MHFLLEFLNTGYFCNQEKIYLKIYIKYLIWLLAHSEGGDNEKEEEEEEDDSLHLLTSSYDPDFGTMYQAPYMLV